MALDPSIALQGRPVDIKPVDVNQTFRTLSEMKYLQARTQAAEEEAARAQQAFDETGAGRRLLSSLGTVPTSAAPPTSATGGPPFDEATLAALPQGGSTPAPTAAQAGTAPAARQRSIFDPDVQAELYRIAPHVADDLLKAGLSTHASTLEGGQKRMENLTRPLAIVRDEASYQAWRTMMSTAVPPEQLGQFPATYPGPDGIAQLQQQAQALDTQFKQGIERSTAETARIVAKTGQQAEARQGGELTYLPDASGGYTAYPKYNLSSATGTPTGPPTTGTPTAAPTGSPTGSPTGTPIGTTLPNTGRPWSAEEAKAYGHLQQGTEAHTLIAQLENTAMGKGASTRTAVSGRVQQTLSQWPWGTTWSTGETQQFNHAKSAFLIAYNHGVLPDDATRQRFEEEFFAKPGETDPKVLKQKQDLRASVLRTMQTETNHPAGVVPPGQRTLQQPGATAASSGTPAEVEGVRAFAASKGETWSPARVAAFIAHAKANNLPLPGGP